MKKKLSVAAVSLIVAVLATSILGFGCKEKVFASETGNATQVTSSNTEYDQLEMPIISINTTAESKISSDEVYTDAQISIINGEGKYELTDIATSIRLRGNSSMFADKPSYKLKFEEKQNLLNIGESKGKTWSLTANYFDGSLLRNLAVYHFADLLTGIAYSPNCTSIELYINGEYRGVYLLSEMVNVNKSRVAIKEELDEVENNGYLVEMSRYSEENMFEVDTATYVVKSDLSETQTIKEQQINYISNYIKESYNALKSGNKKDVEKYIDLDSLVDIYIGNEIVKNVDAGWDSFYMYKDLDGILCFGPMWDFDLAMGNANCVKGFDSWEGFNAYHILNVNANSNPWFCHALSSKWFRELVKERWNELQDKINYLPNAVINEAQSNYQSYCRNFEKWDILGRQVYIEPTQISVLPTFKDHYTYLSNWLDNRVKWLTEHFNSKDFLNGTFVNEDGNIFSENTNLMEISPILALANSPEVDMTYEILPNIGISMSIQKGGSETWDTMAIASGFMLEEGAEYVLSFDYKCSEVRPLSFGIQQNYAPYSPYYTGELKITNVLQHYETIIKAPANDSNCVFGFILGGDTFNGTVVTFDNMSLVKKSAAPPSKIKAGDVNGDGKVNVLDFALMIKYVCNVIKDFPVNDDLAVGDLNKDGSINSDDLSILKKYILRIIKDLPL